MKAIVYQGDGKLSCQSGVPDPEILFPTDVILKVEKAGICGSDLHQLQGRDPLRIGATFGHEVAGTVCDVGSEVADFKVGDRVFSPFSVSCGRGFFCQHGLTARCNHWQVFGHDDGRPGGDPRALGGAQAEFARVPHADHSLIAVPDEMGFAEAIFLADNFSTGWSGVQQARQLCQGPLETLVVMGCGVVGLSAVCAATYLNIPHVIAIDPVQYRREMAPSVRSGTGQLTHLSLPEAQSLIADQCGDRHGVDAVVEAVGRQTALQQAFELIRPFGTICSIGMHTEPSPISPGDEYGKNAIRATGRASVRTTVQEILGLREQGFELPVETLTSDDAIPFEEVQSAYERFGSRQQGCFKLMLEP